MCVADYGYYLNPANINSSNACPANCDCLGRLQMPRPHPGFWTDRSDVEHVDKVYTCSFNTCRGASNDTNPSFCWDLDAFTGAQNPQCASSALLCRPGSEGLLCASCSSGFTQNAPLGYCVACTSSNQTIPLIVLAICVSFFIAIVFVLNIGGRPAHWIEEFTLFRLLMQIDKGMFKIIWATFQESVFVSHP